MSEVRDGYNNPATASTQGEKYGAWVRQQEEERALRRNAPLDTSSPWDQISTGGGSSWTGSSVGGAAGRSESGGLSSPVSSAQAGAWMGAVIALIWAYKPHVGWIALAFYATIGAALGYAGGWTLHWTIVIVGKVLAVALKVAALLFLAWLALQMLPALLR